MSNRPSGSHYVLLWSWNSLQLVRILPNDVFVLVDDETLYRYMPLESAYARETYIPAVRLDNQRIKKVLHYRYLLDLIRDPPTVMSYPSKLKKEVAILNYVTEHLKPSV